MPEGAFDFWRSHLSDHEVSIVEPFRRFGKSVIGLQDPDGLHLELVEVPEVNELDGWSDGTIPAEYAVRGFHGATLAEERHQPTAELLTGHLGFEKQDRRDSRYLFTCGNGLGSAVEIIENSGLNGKPGRGTVHHIAFRTADEEEQLVLRDRLTGDGYHVTEPKDRRYFSSIYFYESGGVLFEIATDGPGFDRDEAERNLGHELKLPPWLEDQRNLIEADLPDLAPPGGIS